MSAIHLIALSLVACGRAPTPAVVSDEVPATTADTGQSEVPDNMCPPDRATPPAPRPETDVRGGSDAAPVLVGDVADLRLGWHGLFVASDVAAAEDPGVLVMANAGSPALIVAALPEEGTASVPTVASATIQDDGGFVFFGDLDADGWGEVVFREKFTRLVGTYDNNLSEHWYEFRIYGGPLAGSYASSAALTWTSPVQSPFVGDQWIGSGAADVDGDGAAELLVGYPDEDGVGVVERIGADATARSAVAWGGRTGGEIADAGDVDGDGVHDLLLGAESAVEIALLLGPLSDGRDVEDADATWSSDPGERLDPIREAGDLDGDGREDVVLCSAVHTWVIAGSAGDGTVDALAVARVDAEESEDDLLGAVSTGDLDRDDQVDLVATGTLGAAWDADYQSALWLVTGPLHGVVDLARATTRIHFGPEVPGAGHATTLPGTSRVVFAHPSADSDVSDGGVVATLDLLAAGE